MTSVLGVKLEATTCSDAAAQIVAWAREEVSRVVCVANVHMLMEAFDSQELCRVLSEADFVVPDGMPLVWMMRLKGVRRQARVYGPALMQHTLRAADRHGIPIGLYGSTPEVLNSLRGRLHQDFPGLRIVLVESPPVADLPTLNSMAADESVLASGARILFVALGCPKQELWMAAHKARIPAVMIGVGAAFDFLAGAKPQSPRWAQSAGLEWLFRLMTEPRRLWRRYLIHNPRFLVLAAAELLGIWRRPC